MESAVEAEESVLDDPSISDEPATDQDIERVVRFYHDTYHYHHYHHYQ